MSSLQTGFHLETFTWDAHLQNYNLRKLVHLHTILQEIMLFADMIERKEKENVTINL
jgi:hypothetical protein